MFSFKAVAIIMKNEVLPQKKNHNCLPHPLSDSFCSFGDDDGGGIAETGNERFTMFHFALSLLYQIT